MFKHLTNHKKYYLLTLTILTILILLSLFFTWYYNSKPKKSSTSKQLISQEASSAVSSSSSVQTSSISSFKIENLTKEIKNKYLKYSILENAKILSDNTQLKNGYLKFASEDQKLTMEFALILFNKDYIGDANLLRPYFTMKEMLERKNVSSYLDKVGDLNGKQIYRGENSKTDYSYYSRKDSMIFYDVDAFQTSNMDPFIFENPNDSLIVRLSLDSKLSKSEIEKYLSIADEMVLSLKAITKSDYKLVQKQFSDMGFSMSYPENFALAEVEKKDVSGLTGLMVDNELQILEFNNTQFETSLISENLEIKIERYLHEKGYKPISPTGGGNIQINSIVCHRPETENCPDDYYLADEKKKIYREKNIEGSIYYYVFPFDKASLSEYMNAIKVENDFDGFIISVTFKDKNISGDEKNKQIKIADEIVRSLKGL